jgi:hypothetical protein
VFSLAWNIHTDWGFTVAVQISEENPHRLVGYVVFVKNSNFRSVWIFHATPKTQHNMFTKVLVLTLLASTSRDQNHGFINNILPYLWTCKCHHNTNHKVNSKFINHILKIYIQTCLKGYKSLSIKDNFIFSMIFKRRYLFQA